MTRRLPLTGILILSLAGCGLQLPRIGGGDVPSAAQAPGAETPRPEARPDGAPPDVAEGAEEPAAGASETPATGGTTLATLGDATLAGLWLETPLVTAIGQGRVTTGTGRSTMLELRPSGGQPGSGSRLSLAAMQALGLVLTAVVEVTVEPL
ncbi:MAG: D-galactarate dehydratase [Pseudomonadota bacterium]